MALTVPDLLEFTDFSNEPVAPDAVAHVEDILQQATDVIWIFTGIDNDPVDERLARIVKYAIFDLTLWLLTQDAHREEINSPFSSERIGSYSYSKMQKAKDGEDSGIYWVDMLFRLLRAPGEEYAVSWVDSERVFNPEGYTFAQQEALRDGIPDYPIWPVPEGERAP
jgi:hypothetical protein